MDIKQIINDRFQKEIKAEGIFSSEKENIPKFIEKVCMANPPYADMFDQDETRSLFDKGNVNVYFKIIAFLAISKDDTQLYSYLIHNMKWKKGFEIRQAYDAQAHYIEEFKPQKITQWFLDNHKNYSGMMSGLGTSFLYCVENSSKASFHQIVNSSSFSTNHTNVYKFLAQTKNTNLFSKIMKKHMKVFGTYTENVIFKETEKNKRYDMMACIYQELIEKKSKIDIIQYIDSLNKNSFTHIAIFFKSSYFKENLEEKLNKINSNSKKTKI